MTIHAVCKIVNAQKAIMETVSNLAKDRVFSCDSLEMYYYKDVIQRVSATCREYTYEYLARKGSRHFGGRNNLMTGVIFRILRLLILNGWNGIVMISIE